MHVYILVAITMAYTSHGHAAGLSREYVGAFATEDTCYQALRTLTTFSAGSPIYSCERKVVQ
jgi:hypothetical protein